MRLQNLKKKQNKQTELKGAKFFGQHIFTTNIKNFVKMNMANQA